VVPKVLECEVELVCLYERVESAARNREYAKTKNVGGRIGKFTWKEGER